MILSPVASSTENLSFPNLNTHPQTPAEDEETNGTGAPKQSSVQNQLNGAKKEKEMESSTDDDEVEETTDEEAFIPAKLPHFSYRPG